MSIPRRGFLGFLAAIPAALAAPMRLFASAPKPPRPQAKIGVPTHVTVADLTSRKLPSSVGTGSFTTSGYSCVVEANSPEVGMPTYTTTTSASGSQPVYFYPGPIYDYDVMMYIDPNVRTMGIDYRGKWGNATYEIDLGIIEKAKASKMSEPVDGRMIMHSSGEIRPIFVKVGAGPHSVMVIILDAAGGAEAVVYIPRADVDKLIKESRNRC